MGRKKYGRDGWRRTTPPPRNRGWRERGESPPSAAFGVGRAFVRSIDLPEFGVRTRSQISLRGHFGKLDAKGTIWGVAFAWGKKGKGAKGRPRARSAFLLDAQAEVRDSVHRG